MGTLEALAKLMDWQGDAKQIVTKVTAQRHTEDKLSPERIGNFVEELKSRQLEMLSSDAREEFTKALVDNVAWKKFDDERERYNETTPMNSCDVLKCSQACFHLFEYLRLLLPEDER